jgi:ATPase subunit of ABC transporter with duplicated ATPase domains
MPKILIGGRKRRAQTTSGKLEVSTFDRAQAAISEAQQAFAELNVDAVMYAQLGGREVPAQKLVAEACAFNVCFQDWLYRHDLSFCWRGCVRVAVKGGNGSGKTTLLKAVLGESFDSRVGIRGQLRRGALATLYIDQRCAGLDDEKSVLDNVRALSASSESELRNGLAKLLFAGDTVYQKVGQLSGGERLRAALAQGLLSAQKPELLVLDEPTNNLDLSNIEFLEGLVRGFRGALLVISHDQTFLDNCEVTEELDVG